MRLTESGFVQDPFVEENDAGAQSDPCTVQPTHQHRRCVVEANALSSKPCVALTSRKRLDVALTLAALSSRLLGSQ